MKVDDYMNKKGFTLVELLGIIVLLSVMVLIAVPAVNKIIRDGKKDADKSNYDVVLNAAYDYVLKENISIDTDETNPKVIKVLELAKAGYLKADTKDNISNSNDDSSNNSNVDIVFNMTDSSGRSLENDEVHVVKIANYDGTVKDEKTAGDDVGLVKYFGNYQFTYIINK